MICRQCATAADLNATLPAVPPQGPRAAYRNIQRRVKNGHGRCKGGTFCDCQHRTTRKVAS
jgi:hypothetical protein